MDEELYQQMLSAGFRFVSFRPRSEKEFREFYRKKFEKRKIHDAALFDKLLERLRELRYIDDTAFAAWWVTQRTGRSPKGPRVIEQELKAKGVDQDIIHSALGSYTSDSSSKQEYALRAIEKKIKLWSTLPLLERKRKIFDFLTRRGFSSETIYSVIDEVLLVDYNKQ